MRFFLAGGAVRDLLFGLVPKEHDIVFDGDPEVFARQSGQTVTAVGRHTPVFIAGGHDHVPLRDGSIQADLASRDFTINALLLEENGMLHALPQTFADLANGVIRQASPTAFKDDPLRIFRAARFRALWPWFVIDGTTLEAMRRTERENALPSLAGERVGRECLKACGGEAPGNFLRVLAETDSLPGWFPELEQARRIPAGPEQFHGNNSVFDHTAELMDRVAEAGKSAGCSPLTRSLAAWMALCHDLGKTLTDPEKLPRHIAHEHRGMELVTGLAERLRLPRKYEKAGLLALRHHMRAGMYRSLRKGTRVDLLHTLLASHGMAESFCLVVAADSGDASLKERILADLDVVRRVKLPEAFRNLGAYSARKLRDLRIKALATPGEPARS